MTAPTDHHWIDDRDTLRELLAAAPAGAPLALDTEFIRRSTFHPRLALVQLGIDAQTLLIDPLAFTPGELFQERLADPDSVCIMHSASEDIEALAPLLPAGMTRLFDTQVAAALTGLGDGLGYQRLVHELLGVELAKAETCSDWLQRPLSAAQRAYAALDVVHLPALRDALGERLEARGRLAWLYEETTRLLARADNEAGPQQPQRKLQRAAHWTPERQALLRRILLWREAEARRIDVPRPWLFKDAQALDLVADPPATLAALRAHLRGQRGLRSEQARGLHEVLVAPVAAAEIEATRPIAPAPDREARARLRDAKAALAPVAAELGISAAFLCPRRLLEPLVLEGTAAEPLRGWRRPWIEAALGALPV